MEAKWIKILSQSPLFQGIGQDELTRMFDCLKPKVNHYPKGEYIGISGEIFLGIGVVLAGKLVVVKENAAGNRIIMTQLGPGGMAGEMAAFSERGVWPATVMAQETSTVMFLSPEKIVGECQKTCNGHQKMIQNLLKIITAKALMLNRKVEYFAIKSMRGKLSTFFLEQYKSAGQTTFMLPMNRNELADFLNVSRPSLSREMGRMRDEGMIEFHQSSIRIKDLEALKKSAHNETAEKSFNKELAHHI